MQHRDRDHRVSLGNGVPAETISFGTEQQCDLFRRIFCQNIEAYRVVGKGESGEVKAIVKNQLPLHVFAKKDDAEGTDFYYLGKATSQDARQTKMAGDNGTELDVVSMTLRLASPIDTSLYEYFAARTGGVLSD